PKRWYRSRRYWAAASVDFTGSRRSSIQLSTRRPYVLAVALMNCHGPTALARETAFVLKPLSTSERKIRSAGRLNSAKTCWVTGRGLLRFGPRQRQCLSWYDPGGQNSAQQQHEKETDVHGFLREPLSIDEVPLESKRGTFRPCR